MADEGRQPVAIRIARPYSSEDAFLENELDTLTRTSVVLVGAQSRPQGVVLRFEVTLASGAPLLRGEGRVVGFKPNAWNGEPGLTLRFTRLDPKSKALVDRAAAMRDARAKGNARPAPAPVAPPPTVTDASDPLETTNAGPPPSVVMRAARAMQPTIPDAPISRSLVRSEEDTEQGHTSVLGREERERIHSERLAREAAEEPPPQTHATPAEPESGATEIGEAPPITSAQPVPPTLHARDLAFSGPPTTQPRLVPTPPPPATSHVMSASPSTLNDAAEPPPATSPAAAVAPPTDRSALLDRLRDRARSLPASRVGEILTTGS